MDIDIEFKDLLISESQAETFAYNTYRDVSNYLKENRMDFILWSMEVAAKNCMQTIDGIVYMEWNNEFQYKLCNYKTKMIGVEAV